MRCPLFSSGLILVCCLLVVGCRLLLIGYCELEAFRWLLCVDCLFYICCVVCVVVLLLSFVSRMPRVVRRLLFRCVVLVVWLVGCSALVGVCRLLGSWLVNRFLFVCVVRF